LKSLKPIRFKKPRKIKKKSRKNQEKTSIFKTRDARTQAVLARCLTAYVAQARLGKARPLMAGRANSRKAWSQGLKGWSGGEDLLAEAKSNQG
jgi:hypothetical protein